MDAIEKAVVGLAATLLLSFVAALFISLKFFGLNVATCITSMKPFDKGEVKASIDPQTFQEKYVVKLVARMWTFEPSEIVVSAGAPIELYLSSPDVVHGFSVGGTNANLMAVPGTVNFATLKFDEPGEYPFLCHEYCGVGHQAMAAKFIVRPKGQMYQHSTTKVAYQTDENQNVLAGKALIEKNGCTACHSVDGKPLLAPSFKGMWGREQHFVDGSKVNADEAYIKDSIQNPNSKIVKGFQPLMPVLPLSDQEIDQIVEFIKTIP